MGGWWTPCLSFQNILLPAVSGLADILSVFPQYLRENVELPMGDNLSVFPKYFIDHDIWGGGHPVCLSTISFEKKFNFQISQYDRTNILGENLELPVVDHDIWGGGHPVCLSRISLRKIGIFKFHNVTGQMS